MFAPPLPVGEPAPPFVAKDHLGNTVSNETLRGHWTVFVFYIRDDTPGCTAQLGALRDGWKELQAAGARVYGVNPASGERHLSYAKKLDLPFPLIVDNGNRVARVFRSNWGPVVRRTVYVIAPDGCIAFAERGAPPVERVLNAMK